jgi:hypothetical protein
MKEAKEEVVMPPFYRRMSFWIMTKSTFYALLAPVCMIATAPLLYFGVNSPILFVIAAIISIAVYKLNKKLAIKSDMLFDASKARADKEMRELYEETTSYMYDTYNEKFPTN